MLPFPFRGGLKLKALITGASSGIGRELAKKLVNQYDEIVIVARSEDKLNELQDELLKRNAEAKVKIAICDVSVLENCIKLHEENPGVDLLINNAGFGDYGFFTETSLEKELSMIQTNITAYHILTKLYLTDMKKADKGRILNVASIAGFMPGPLMATYYATKAYVVRLSEAIREELRREKSKVKISILCPGPVETNFNQVANVNFSLKGLSSKYVAEYTIKHLNDFYIVPGFLIRLARHGTHLVSSSFAANMAYNMQKKKAHK